MFIVLFFIIILSYNAHFKHGLKKSDILLSIKKESIKIDTPGSANLLNFLISIKIVLIKPLLIENSLFDMFLVVIILINIVSVQTVSTKTFSTMTISVATISVGNKKASYDGFLNC